MKTPKKRKADDAAKVKEVLDKTAKIAELVNKSLVIIKDVGIENKPLKNFWLSPAQRDVLLTAPGISQPVKTKLARSEGRLHPCGSGWHDTGPSRRRTRQRGSATSGFSAGRQASLGTVAGGDDRSGDEGSGKEQGTQGQDPCRDGLPVQDHLAGHRASDLAANPDQGLHLGQAA